MTTQRPQPSAGPGPVRATDQGARSRTLAFAAALALMLGAAAGLSFAVSQLRLYLRKLPIEVPQKVASIPTETPSWKQVGLDERMPDEMVAELGTKNYLTRQYIQKSSADDRSPVVLDLHLAYYTGMVDTVPHIPDRCLVGGGWSIDGQTRVLPLPLDQDLSVWRKETVPEETGTVYSARLIPVPGEPGSRARLRRDRVNLPRDADTLAIRVNPYTHPKEKNKLYAGYFFIANGGHCHRAEDVRLLAFRLTDSYAYYLKVQVSSLSVSSEEEFARAAASLLSELLPDIMLCVPDWVEVLRGEYPEDNPLKGRPRS